MSYLRRVFLLSAATILAVAYSALAEATIRSATTALALPDEEFAKRNPFELTGTVIATYPNGLIYLCGDDGCFEAYATPELAPKRGQRVTVSGYTEIGEDESPARNLRTTAVKVVGEGSIPEPETTTVRDIARSENFFRFVKVRCTITDAFADEIDAGWNYLIVRDGINSAYTAIPNVGDLRKRLANFIDADVELTGTVLPGYAAGFRVFIGPYLRLWDESCIRILKSAPADPFSLPALEDIHHVPPEKIASMRRHTATGDVIAAWSGGNLLLREDSGRIVGVELADATQTPPPGVRAKVVGYPETDLYRINLARAILRIEPGEVAAFPPPESVTPAQILLDELGRQMINPTYHGKLVKMRGEVRTVQTSADGGKTFFLESDGMIVSVDLARNREAAADVEVSCHIEVTGVCVLKSQNWRPGLFFPRIDGLVLVPRSPADVRILSRPPWWTPGRLLAIVGILVAVIVAVLVWNRSLRRLAELRGCEVARAEISKASAELRIEERTRLAAELHDALAQNLTGVSLQISAARSAKASSPEAEERHLSVAEHMLQSSRTELRRCIWDLRSDALDEPDFAKAVTLTTKPVAGHAEIDIDCKVPRSRLSDSTAHALLRIIRELVSNAAVHGKATRISVCGAVDNGMLSVTVCDNGIGFDVGKCPGQADGHFGLAGIRERCKGLGAAFRIESTPGKGTTATIEMELHE